MHCLTYTNDVASICSHESNPGNEEHAGQEANGSDDLGQREDSQGDCLGDEQRASPPPLESLVVCAAVDASTKGIVLEKVSILGLGT